MYSTVHSLNNTSECRMCFFSNEPSFEIYKKLFFIFQISLKYVYNNIQLFETEIVSKAFSIVCFIVYNKKS